MSEEIDYSVLYQPKKVVYVIKKDGSKEAFNVQKVIVAVGKSAYRALTKFTDLYPYFLHKLTLSFTAARFGILSKNTI